MNKFKEISVVEEIKHYVSCPYCGKQISNINFLLQRANEGEYCLEFFCENCDHYYDVKICPGGKVFVRESNDRQPQMPTVFILEYSYNEDLDELIGQ